MTAVFRDSIGCFTIQNVSSMYYEVNEKKWNVFFNDESHEEYEDVQLVEVSQK